MTCEQYSVSYLICVTNRPKCTVTSIQMRQTLLLMMLFLSPKSIRSTIPIVHMTWALYSMSAEVCVIMNRKCTIFASKITKKHHMSITHMTTNDIWMTQYVSKIHKSTISTVHITCTLYSMPLNVIQQDCCNEYTGISYSCIHSNMAKNCWEWCYIFFFFVSKKHHKMWSI